MRYLIRNDVGPAYRAHVDGLAAVIGDALPAGMSVEIVDVPSASDQQTFNACTAPIVSLDKRYPGDYQLHVCRLFADHATGDPQTRPLRVTARPGTATLTSQMQALPSGPVLFVDDDVASGFTRHQVLALLSRVRPDIEVLGWERFTTAYTGEVYDIVDASDFIAPTLHEGGLVVDVAGVRMRRPYWSAHVNLETRARIPNTLKPALQHAAQATLAYPTDTGLLLVT